MDLIDKLSYWIADKIDARDKRTPEQKDADGDKDCRFYIGYVSRVIHPYAYFKVNRIPISAKEYRTLSKVNEDFLGDPIEVNARLCGYDYDWFMDEDHTKPILIAIHREGFLFEGGYPLWGHRYIK